MEVEDIRKQGFFDRLKNNSVFKKLKSIKNIQIIVAIFIIAVALIIYSSVMSSRGGKSEATGSVMTSDEQRLSAILSRIEGAGEVEAMITVSDKKIVGVLIIAEGADSITVRVRLMEAAATALGVDKNIVSVLTSTT